MPPRRLIFAEFNELCPWLIDQWMGKGLLPNFQRMHDASAVFETQADVADPGSLEPWIQWYSLHTGLSYAQHGVFHLTEGATAQHDDLWRVAHAAGRRVGCFASMNTRAFDFADSFYVADPWCEDSNASPPALNIYNRFVGANVREYSNPDARMGLTDYAQFLAFMTSHGLRPGTVRAIATQLLEEKTRDPRLSWKRVALLDRMQFDVFRHYYRRTKPDFATFFINSTAHLQHSYWRYLQPEAFTIKPDVASTELYGDAIKFGYRAMDRLLGKFMALADASGAMLVFMSALSQQPYLAAEEKGGRQFYRLRDVEAFFQRLGLPFRSIDPTMTHQYLARFDRDEDRGQVLSTLSELKMDDGRVLFDFNEQTQEGLYFSCNLGTDVAPDARVLAADGSSFAFDAFLYKIDAIKSGRHHPAGALWFRGDRHARHTDPVSILDVFPTTLDLMGIGEKTPGDRTGVSRAAAIAA